MSTVHLWSSGVVVPSLESRPTALAPGRNTTVGSPPPDRCTNIRRPSISWNSPIGGAAAWRACCCSSWANAPTLTQGQGQPFARPTVQGLAPRPLRRLRTDRSSYARIGAVRAPRSLRTRTTGRRASGAGAGCRGGQAAVPLAHARRVGYLTCVQSNKFSDKHTRSLSAARSAARPAPLPGADVLSAPERAPPSSGGGQSPLRGCSRQRLLSSAVSGRQWPAPPSSASSIRASSFASSMCPSTRSRGSCARSASR